MPESPKGPRDPTLLLWLKKWRKIFLKSYPSKEEDALETHPQVEKSQYKDWLESVDKLQPLVRRLRNDIDKLEIQQLTFDVLGAGTFLLQIDLMLIKLRQHLNNYERRRTEVNLKIPAIKLLFDKIERGCKQCFVYLLALAQALEQCGYKDLENPEILHLVKALESESKSLTQIMYELNETILKKDPVYQLFETELFKTLMNLEHEDVVSSRASFENEPKISNLRDKANLIQAQELRSIGFHLISSLEGLKRASILFHSTQASRAMDAFKNQVETFLDLANQPDAEVALKTCLLLLFADLEAMRFARLKGLSDKSKVVKHQLKQVLSQSVFGQSCLKSLQLSPRDKLSLKQKF